MDVAPCPCGSTFFTEGGYGLDFCLNCGLGRPGCLRTVNQFVYQDRIPGLQSYTRLKRFKKYLCRAMRQQSSCTVPKETWDYLLARRPYRDTQHIQWTLKQARTLKRKCYDSLPFLTAALCPHLEVPCIDELEKARAIEMFHKIDAACLEGPFISYLFCLEFILRKLGRDDVCLFINLIQCPKRRIKYTERLEAIFNTVAVSPRTSIMNRLRRLS